MKKIKIDIVDPKAKKINRDEADLDLIIIHGKDPLNNLGTQSNEISIGEIAKEVELVRSKK